MYRITITDAQATDKEQINLHCTIQQSADGETWTDLEGAPTALFLPLSSVRGALRAPGGKPEQRAALQELIRTTARALPALYGAVAVEAIEELLPHGWPVTLPL